MPAASCWRTVRYSSGDIAELSGGGVDPGLPQRLDLVAHQGDQRRDDDGDAGPAESRNLIAHRLAGAGGEQHDGVAAVDDVADHILLLAAKRGVAEDVAQHRQGIARRLGSAAQLSDGHARLDHSGGMAARVPAQPFTAPPVRPEMM